MIRNDCKKQHSGYKSFNIGSYQPDKKRPLKPTFKDLKAKTIQLHGRLGVEVALHDQKTSNPQVL